MKKFILSLIMAVVLAIAAPQVLPSNNAVTTVEAAKVNISNKKVTLLKGQKLQLKISGTKSKIKWSSNKKAVATVNSKGRVTAKKKGTATITAKVSKKSYRCKVTVEDPKNIKINNKKATLIKGQTLNLKISGTKIKVKWSSNKADVATVSSKGKVIAKKKGTATITAKVNNKSYRCKVTVEEPKINYTTLTIEVGKSDTLKISNTKQKVTWSSSKKKVATVSSKGKVTAKSKGSTTITGKIGKKKYTCKVNVSDGFDLADAKKALKTSEIRIDEEVNNNIIAIVENTYGYGVQVVATCVFYDKSGNILSTSSNRCYHIDSNSECALRLYGPTEGFEKIRYDSYKIDYKVSKPSGKSNVKGISCKSNFSSNSVMVEVKNNSNKTSDYTDIAIIFYCNGKAVGYENKYANVDKIGDVDYLKFDFPKDNDNKYYNITDYKVFLNNSYSVW